MALQYIYLDDSGVMHTEAYLKVVMVELDVLSLTGVIVTNIYHSVNTRLTNKMPVIQKKYRLMGSKDFSPHFGDSILKRLDNSPIANSYRFLKSLPEFINSLNV